MTRDEKILDFMSTQWGGRNWCSGGPCACRGAVNCSLYNKWIELNPDEPPIRQEEYNEMYQQLPPDERKPISIDFKSYKK